MQLLSLEQIFEKYLKEGYCIDYICDLSSEQMEEVKNIAKTTDKVVVVDLSMELIHRINVIINNLVPLNRPDTKEIDAKIAKIDLEIEYRKSLGRKKSGYFEAIKDEITTLKNQLWDLKSEHDEVLRKYNQDKEKISRIVEGFIVSYVLYELNKSGYAKKTFEMNLELITKSKYFTYIMENEEVDLETLCSKVPSRLDFEFFDQMISPCFIFLNRQNLDGYLDLIKTSGYTNHIINETIEFLDRYCIRSIPRMIFTTESDAISYRPIDFLEYATVDLEKNEINRLNFKRERKDFR